MKIAITGATGFVGGHLARRLVSEGHEVVGISRHAVPQSADSFNYHEQEENHDDREGYEFTRTVKAAVRWASAPVVLPSSSTPGIDWIASDLSNVDVLTQAFSGCDAVAHCAGINREIGSQTYQRIHVEGTRNVVEAAKRAGVKRISLMSFLRARPNCGSPYHESKWAAEEILRNSGLDYTIVKAGMVYGRGDHMLDHLSHAFHTLPLLATVGFRQKAIRPLAIDDLIHVLRAASIDGRLPRKTIALTGAEELYLSDAAHRVAQVLGRRILIFPAPLWFHRILAQVCEWTMKVPLVAKAQIRILSEGVVEPATPCDPLPADLLPTRQFTPDQIRSGLPEPGPFGLRDLPCCLG